MDERLLAIKDNIQSGVTSKIDPTANPTKVLAVDESNIMNATVDYLDYLNTRLVPTPLGVEWVTVPGPPTFGDASISETASEIKVNGVNRTVAAATLSVPWEPSGHHRIDLVVVNYEPLTTAAAYGIVSGVSGLSSETVIAPALPVNSILVRTILVQASSFLQIPVTVVTSGSINGNANVAADPAGKLNLLVAASEIPYTPADTNNTTGFWAGLLGTGKTLINLALDKVATTVTTLTNTVSTLATTVSGHTTTLATHTTNIATNAANIATNTANIASNTTAISGNTSAIAANTANITANTTAISLNTPEAFTALTIGTTTTWATGGKFFNNKILTLTQNTTLAITGHVNAAEGTLIVRQDGIGSRTITLPATSDPAVINLNTAANGKTILGWKYDGTNINWTYKPY